MATWVIEDVITDFKRHGVYVTRTRIAVMHLLLQHKGVVSVADIVRLSGQSLDRITVHRVIHFFLEKGLVHGVPTKTGDLRFIIGSQYTGVPESPRSLSVYLICERCRRTVHVEDRRFPDFAFNVDFTVKNYHIVGEGVCEECEAIDAAKAPADNRKW